MRAWLIRAELWWVRRRLAAVEVQRLRLTFAFKDEMSILDAVEQELRWHENELTLRRAVGKR